MGDDCRRVSTGQARRVSSGKCRASGRFKFEVRSAHFCRAARSVGKGQPRDRARVRTLIVVRRNAAAARMIEAPCSTSVTRRSSSSFVQGWFLESTAISAPSIPVKPISIVAFHGVFDQHSESVATLGAIEGPLIGTAGTGFDTRQHHGSLALRTARSLNCNARRS
jgi:hypothetical protein